MEKTHYLSLALLLLPLICHADPITALEARKTAESFFHTSITDNGTKHAPAVITLTSATADETDTLPFYAFNRGSDSGFILVAGDDQMPSVIGYADNGHFSYETMPENMKAYLNAYSEYIDAIQSGAVMHKSPEQYTPETPVAPLMSVTWGQDAPYNRLCPTSSYGGNMPTGCVATAMAQVMKYYRYPETGTGFHSYWRYDGNITVDFSQSHYDWDNMPDSYLGEEYTESQADAVALLMRDLGVAVEMQYTPAASGAYSADIAPAMIEYFGYSSKATEIFRSNTSTTEWMELIYNQLQTGHPIIYGASTLQGEGHQFVCDGIDANGLLHINWGWDGMSNGYFDINYMQPAVQGTGSGTGGYIQDASIIIDLEPATQGNDRPITQLLSMRQDISCSAKFGRKNITFDAPAVWNTSGRNFEGEIGVVLAGDDSAYILTWKSWTLDAWYYNRCNIITTIPDDIVDGTYKAYFVSRKSDYPEGEYDKIQVPTNIIGYVTLVISGDKVTVTPEEIFIKLEQSGAITCENDIFQGIKQNLVLPLQNSGNTFYKGFVTLHFYDETTQAESYLTSNNNVLIYDDSSIDVAIEVDFSDFNVGRYYVDAFADGEIIPHDGERSVIEVNSPASLPAIYLTKPLYGTSQFTQGSDNTLTISVRIAEQGDYTLRLWATNLADGSSKMAYEGTWYDMSVNTNEELGMSPYCYNLVPGNYTFYCEWLNPATNQYEALQPAKYNQFTTSVQSSSESTDIILTEPLRIVESTDNIIYSELTYTVQASLKNTLSSTYNGNFMLRIGYMSYTFDEVTIQPDETKTVTTKFITYGWKDLLGYQDCFITTSQDYQPLTPYEYSYQTIEIRDGSGLKAVKGNTVSAHFSGDILYISPVAENSRITVTDLAGHTLASMTASGTEIVFPLNIPKGIYLISIAGQDGIQTVKAIK